MVNNFEITHGFIECAKNDIHAARLLLLGENYPLAVYHVAQANEKLVKAMSVEFDKNGVARFPKSHETICYLINRFIIDGSQKTDTDGNANAKNAITLLRNAKMELARSSALDIRTAHAQAQAAISSLLPGIHKNFDEADASKYISPDDLHDFLKTFFSISILHMFLAPHDQSTRYPDQEIRPWDYTSDLGIVACLPDILDWMDEAIDGIEKRYDRHLQ